MDQKTSPSQEYGVADDKHLDMSGLDNLIVYDEGEKNNFLEIFIQNIANEATNAIAKVSESSYERKENIFDTRTL